MNWNIEVYDKDRKRLAILENAYNIGYTKEKNNLSTAEFALQIDDVKNDYCKPFNLIKIYENGEYIDTFRILPSLMTKTAATSEITYTCEHILGTLLDTSLFQYHEIGGIGTRTRQILNYILSKQNNWVLGQCDFERQFQYSWENETLLSALYSIPREFDEEYAFTWDTTAYPYIINLIRPSIDIKAYLRYNRNMSGIKKKEDGSIVCTRLYALGYGEGVNQLGITKINPTGKAYIEADTVAEYGIIEKIWCDRRYQIEANLYNAAKAKLEKIKQPKITYEIEAVELYALTGIPIDKFDEGDIIRVIDEDIGVDVTTRIVKKSKNNIEKDYISATITISSDGESSRTSLSSLEERAKINDQNSQGATNINNYNYYGNCDTNYPAKIRFKIPEEAVNINKVELSFQADAFRAYSRAIKGGGATTATTSSGGGVYKATNSGGGGYETTDSGGGTSTTTSSGGGGYETSTYPYWEWNSPSAESGNQAIGDVIHGDVENHSHKFNNYHRHDIDIPDHRHDIDIPDHKHDIQLPSHTHDIRIDAHTHSITLQDHTHDIEYGIYEGPTASRFAIRVDNNATTLTSTVDSVDIVKYLSKDDGGRIVRGWHEVLIFPNNLCMINADVMVQVFVNSRGGGNY